MEKNKIVKELEELFKGSDLADLDIGYAYDEGDTANDFMEKIREQINENEVIYYSNAMKYLCDNDASLHRSLTLADADGYRPKDLSSETLATLLQNDIMHKELSNLHKEIALIFEQGEEENDQ